MDKFSLYVPNFLPFKEYFIPEKNNACPGCGLALAVRQTYKAIESDMEKAVWQMPADGKLFGGLFDKSPVGKSEPSLLIIKKGKAELTICFDNEAGGTLNEAIKKSMPAIAVAEGFKYVATACPSYPFDMHEKIKQGLEVEGRAYIHILCPCPAGWQFDPEITVKIGRWAVESRAFPLYEVGGGTAYHLTVNTPKPRALADYLKPQKRFESLSEKDIEAAAAAIEIDYKKLTEKIQPE